MNELNEKIKIALVELNKAMAKFAVSLGKENKKAFKNFGIAANKYLDKN